MGKKKILNCLLKDHNFLIKAWTHYSYSMWRGPEHFEPSPRNYENTRLMTTYQK